MRIVTMNGALVFPGLDVPHGWNDPALLGDGAARGGRGRVGERPGRAVRRGRHRDRRLGAAADPGHRRPTRCARSRPGQGFLGFDAGARWGSGFLLDSAPSGRLLGPRSFGNDGAGGQFAFGDDEYGVGFAYVANRMIGHGDPRATRLITAVRTCLG